MLALREAVVAARIEQNRLEDFHRDGSQRSRRAELGDGTSEKDLHPASLAAFTDLADGGTTVP